MRNILFCFLLTGASLCSAATNSLPKFDEVYKLLRANLGGMSESELDQAAVRGLITQLHSKVMLGDSREDAAPLAVALSNSQIFDNSFEYFRIAKVTGDLAGQLAASHKQNCETNSAKLKGVVLDLRFATGLDYPAAGAVADLFLATNQVLLDWGTGSVSSTQKTNAITLPVAVLINSQTSGAAEALAAVLRETHVGLLIGGATPGHACVFKEVPLSNGSKLCIATAQVKIKNKEVAGLVPDIALSTSLEDEKAYFLDAYKILPKFAASTVQTNQNEGAPTNHAHRRFNEAELVRQQREGADSEQDGPVKPYVENPSRPLIADPVLARALDLLKALAVVRQGREG